MDTKILAACALTIISGCSHWKQLNTTQKGAVVGAGSGAVIGSAVAGPIGTVVGGVGGALAGGVTGSEIKKSQPSAKKRR